MKNKKIIIFSLSFVFCLFIAINVIISIRYKDMLKSLPTMNSNMTQIKKDKKFLYYLGDDFFIYKIDNNASIKVINDLSTFFHSNGDSLYYISGFKSSIKENKGILYKYTNNVKKELVNIDNGDFAIYNGNIYYTFNNNICSCDLNGKNKKEIFKNVSQDKIIFINEIQYNTIFYSVKNSITTTLYSIDINGKNNHKLLEGAYNKIKLYNNKIYFLNENNELSRVDLNGNNLENINAIKMLSYDFSNNSLYYIDDKDTLNQIELSGTEKEIARDVIDFKIMDNKLYFSVFVNNNIELLSVGLDGLDKISLCSKFSESFQVEKY